MTPTQATRRWAWCDPEGGWELFWATDEQIANCDRGEPITHPLSGTQASGGEVKRAGFLLVLDGVQVYYTEGQGDGPCWVVDDPDSELVERYHTEDVARRRAEELRDAE